MARLTHASKEDSESPSSPRIRPSRPILTNASPDKVVPGRSPQKPNGETSVKEEEHAQARQQRLLRSQHVESLLLPSVARNNIIHARPNRMARETVRNDFTSAKLFDDQEEALGSDWEDEKGKDKDSFVDQNERAFWEVHRASKSASTAARGGHSTLVHRSKARTEVVDLTSPEKNICMSSHAKNATRRDGYYSDVSGSSDNDRAATIRFSPPRLKSPSKQAPEKPITPPQSPAKSKLMSPRKLQHIPPTPHRPSLDTFWDQESVNVWNDKYSPRKNLNSPRKIQLPASDDDDSDSPPASPRKGPWKSPAKRDRAAIEAKKVFERGKFKVAVDFLCELDEKIVGGEVSRLAASSGGIKLIWSKKLNSTAGRANWRREATRTRNEDGTSTTTYLHIASIELAEKVIDDEHRLLNVVAHEFCHLINFMISNIRDQPHGASFKAWAAKVSKAFASRNVTVTTKHTYQISYKYAWQCVEVATCGVEYTRHSKSIDPTRHTCGKCKARLVQVRPVPRKTAVGGEDGAVGKGGRSQYQTFVKEHFGSVRRELGTASPMKDVMKELGVRYRSKKESGAKVVSGPVEVVEIFEADEGSEEVGVVKDSQAEEVDKVSRVLDFLTIGDD